MSTPIDRLLENKNVQVYIVGGAPRDILLGNTPKDIDYVVVGATPDDMIAQGFKKVGADFPVFLSPTGDEYALARTERKTAPGYNGFETMFDSSVTINPELFSKFIELGYDPDQEYDFNELMEVFRHINQ